MRHFFNWLLILGLITAIPAEAAEHKTVREKKCKDLHKKTAQGFRVPYTLRYNPDEWSCRHTDGGQDFVSLKNSNLKITISSNPKEVNLTREELDQRFQEHAKNLHSDLSFYANYDIKPSELVTINGINFLHQSELITLAPDKVRHRAQMQKGYSSASLSNDQMDFYTYSGDKGSIYICIESAGLISQEDQLLISELFRGFSFDGSACKGPTGLRSLKTAFEMITDK
jgi:hypothetical protein